MLKTTIYSKNSLATYPAYPSKTKLNSNSAFLLNLYGKMSERGGINLRNLISKVVCTF
jgi:hypothetical protein